MILIENGSPDNPNLNHKKVLGRNDFVIHSTFRNIDALVHDKSLAAVNGEDREDRSNIQNQGATLSPFHPFPQQEHQQATHPPSREVQHQLPPPLNPVETRVTR